MDMKKISTAAAWEVCSTLALTCILSPPRRGFLFSRFQFIRMAHGKPAMGISKDAETVSPSPWGEGRGEGEC
jgi:hypothetical protein